MIIGHSLGGIYARELARMEPALIERIFLLGSPVKHALGNTSPYLRPLVAAMRLMHGRCLESVSASCGSCGLDLPESAPEVPETCIYTKTDGIVEWHSCLDEGPQVECVEVDSSHCGIPLNLKAWQEISSRLRAPSRKLPFADGGKPRSALARWRLARPTGRRPPYLRLVCARSPLPDALEKFRIVQRAAGAKASQLAFLCAGFDQNNRPWLCSRPSRTRPPASQVFRETTVC